MGKVFFSLLKKMEKKIPHCCNSSKIQYEDRRKWKKPIPLTNTYVHFPG